MAAFSDYAMKQLRNDKTVVWGIDNHFKQSFHMFFSVSEA
jgi:hypothetical protein